MSALIYRDQKSGALFTGADGTIPLRWQLRQVGDEQHVTPLNDLREHVESADCWCKPFQPPHAEPDMWAHNSMDRREEHERGKKEH